jgi:hypothetical protein
LKFEPTINSKIITWRAACFCALWSSLFFIGKIW